MQAATTSELSLIRTAPVLQPVTRLEVVSRSDPSDVRLVLDTSDSDYDPEQTGLLDGQVSVNTQGEALRSVSLSLVDWTGEWFPGPGNKIWLDAYLKVQRGYVGTRNWDQGVYVLADPAISDRRIVRLQGVDKASRANGRDEGGFTTIVRLLKGQNVEAAIETLAAYETWGETLLNLTATDSELPYEIECQLTEFPWTKAKEIAGIPGNYRPLHFDERGYLTWAPDPDPNLLSPVWEIWPDGSRPGSASDEDFSFYVEASKQIDARQLKNWVGVRGGSGKSMPVYAEASDTDANSPTAVSRIGYRMYWHNGGRSDPLITTQTEADARAAYELRERKRWTERVPLRINELPILQPWDVLRITNPDAGLNDTYQIVSYNLPLAGSAEMTLEGWRVRRAVG